MKNDTHDIAKQLRDRGIPAKSQDGVVQIEGSGISIHVMGHASAGHEARISTPTQNTFCAYETVADAAASLHRSVLECR